MFHYSFYSPILRVCIYVCQSAFVLPVSGGLFFIKKKKKLLYSDLLENTFKYGS